jgi:hypothetical protein
MVTQSTFWTSIKSQFGEKDIKNEGRNTLLVQENLGLSEKLHRL